MSDVRLLKLSNYVRPEIKETYLAGKQWVLNGDKNSFFQYVIDRYNGSPTNAAIINSYCDLAYGRGLADMATEDEVGDDIKKILPKEDLKRIIKDYMIFSSSTITIDKANKKIGHIPRESIAPNQMVQETAEIKGFWHCYDWTNLWRYKPTLYSAFDKEIEEADDEYEIMTIQPYQPGKMYFSDPEYLSGLQYAEMEEEMSNYSINHIKSGLSFGYIINFNNGSNLTEKQKDDFVTTITDKLTGSSNAGRFIASFNDDKESAITIEPFEITDAHEQWSWLSNEAQNKLLRAHRVTNPIIVGIKEDVGLGNNADEMDVSERQLMKRTIAPKQETILDALELVLAGFGIKKELYFLPLTELDEDGDSLDSDGEKVDKVKKEEKKEKIETELKKHSCNLSKFSIELSKKLIDLGEDDSDEWDLISDEPVNYDTCDELDSSLFEVGLSLDFPFPGAKSEQDKGLYKVRYKYAPSKASDNSRSFCREMVMANKVYRKEDIVDANSLIENPGWGEFGTEKYNLWLYKGGGDCNHFWRRRVYFRKRNADGTFMVNKGLKNDKEVTVKDAREKGVPITKNASEVARKPKTMAKRGFLHRFKQFLKFAGFDPSQRRGEDGKWEDVGDNSSLEDLEKKIRNNKFETAVVYDKDGNIVWVKKGKKNSVTITFNEQIQMGGLQGKFLTHNHPVDTSFSPADLNLSLTNRLSGMRALTQTQTYTLVFTDKFMNPSQVSLVLKDYKRYSRLTRILLTNDFHAGKITKEDFSLLFDHRIMERLSEDYSEFFTYTKS